MPVTASYLPTTATGNGVTTVFAYQFRVLSASHILAAVNGVQTGVSVSGVGSANGGNVTFASPPASGSAIVISRNVPYDRETDYQNNGDLLSDTLDDDLDRVVMQVQQLLEKLGRAPLLPLGSGLAGTLAMPTPAAGQYLRWRADALNLENAAAVQDLGNFTQSGTGAVQRTALSKLGEVVTVQDFGARGDGLTDDTAAIQAAFNALSAYQTLVFPAARYKTNGCITTTADNIGVHFENATFLVGDTGPTGTAINGGVGKIGFLFNGCDDLTVTGAARFLGQGTIGVTSLAGVVFDACNRVNAPAQMFFHTMAAGRMVFQCANSQFGNIIGIYIDGLQTFESPPTNTAGSTDVIVGTSLSTFGDCVSVEGQKPARYMSVGFGSNNIGLTCGASVYAHDGASGEGHALAVRSAIDCAFGPVVSIGGAYSALFLVQYAGDQALGYAIQRVSVSSVAGVTGPTGGSTDCLVYAESFDAAQIGHVKIGNISGNASGEFGVYNTGANLHVDSIDITGSATRLIAVHALAAGYAPELNVGLIRIGGNTGLEEPIALGRGARFTARYVDFWSGPTSAGVSVAVFYDGALGHAGAAIPTFDIGTVRYRQNGSAQNYAYVVFMPFLSPSHNSIHHIDGDGVSVAPASFGGDNFHVRWGRLMSTAAPTGAVPYLVGDCVWKSNVAAAGVPGWVCTTGGTPGIWKAMAAVAA